MSDRLYSGRTGEETWNTYWESFNLSGSRKATHELTVKNVLELLREQTNLENNLNILDLGCGQGDIDILLALKSNFSIIATDISEKALKSASEKVIKYNLKEKIALIKADGYDLSFRDNSFDIILSFGYGSVGSYIEIQKEIYRTLKPDGVAIIDFRHLSIYNTLLAPKNFYRQLKRYRSGSEAKIYHLGRFGLKKYYQQFGLILEDIRPFNTYPPLGILSNSPYLFMLFEDTLGKLLRPILARVFLAKFRKASL